MISKIGDAKSFCYFKHGQNGKSSPRRRMAAEAVQKAEDLKPDLIVLDIGLPKLNGIEAARQIRQLSPSSKIVFLSQNNDLGVVGQLWARALRVTFIRWTSRRDFCLLSKRFYGVSNLSVAA